MSITHFRRIEQKYLLNEKEYLNVLEELKPYLVEDEYFKSHIYNIYFDTRENDFIIKSLEKPRFKTKLRLRSYGIPTKDSKVFLEIKQKYKGIVGKRRMELTLKEFDDYYKSKEKKSQIQKEIDYYFKKYSLEPKLFLAYDRDSYKGKEHSGLRITFDQNIRSRREKLRLELGDGGEKLFDENLYVMEIKSLHSLPLEITKILSRLKIYPTSFSKYGKIYQKNKKEEMRYV
ncbi:MAG: polyphosphate polymerase domain-containing protein [Bacilli bacterium]|nr:polyphosphate polymerase domain-containing protein [Bacilli bacterium]MBR1817328.1 polyphosphate polymerase domain-containing protein [Bacilli bacterium]